MTQDFAAIGLDELLAQLAAGHAAGVTVVTPNQRLAQALLALVDARHRQAGLASWEAADVLPSTTFLARCLDEARYADPGADVPELLSDAEAHLLWEEAIRAAGSPVLSAPATASLAMSAWELAHDWRIENALDRPGGNADTEAFALWRRAYERRAAKGHWTDPARVGAWIIGALQQPTLMRQAPFPLPKRLVLHGFDVITPAQRDLVGAFARAGVEVRASYPQARTGRVARLAFASPREELEACARWARARLDASATRAAGAIAVVVPDLAQRRAQVLRVFDRMLPGAFNLSLGEPLHQVPLVDAALAIVELGSGEVPFDRASRLLRSPYVDGSDSELAARARLDAALRRLAPATVTLHRLRAWVPQQGSRRRGPACPRFIRALDGLLAAARGPARAAPHEWARRFTAMLAAVGFPGERALDSAEYQAQARWEDLLRTFAGLSSLGGAAWTSGEARSRLRRLATEAVFQPASGNAPVQVLGLLESAGLVFDHLWVSGLTEEAWPLPARPHALILPALQRQAGVPQASAESSLELDRALTARWREAAGEVIFSSAQADGDRELLPSPLVRDVPLADAAALVPDVPSLRMALFAAGQDQANRTSVTDAVAPPVARAGVQGGTGILGDQAACPFRAFAHFRLDARRLERPESGLGPMERGNLLHDLMARIWGELRDQATLKATPQERLEALAAEAARHAVDEMKRERPGRLEGRFAELEVQRLARVALAWLAIERDERKPFEVTMREEKMTLTAGGLMFQGRVDRIDRLLDEGGGLAVIDYKSGNVKVGAWLRDRPDDPQLPLYALAASDEDVRAVAFARLKTGELGFEGLSREAGVLPNVKTVQQSGSARRWVDSWEALQAAWRTNVDLLAEDFAAGDARVDPKRLLTTCERCDLQPFCRVHERLGTLAEDDFDEDEA